MLDFSDGFSIGGLIIFIISLTAVGLCLFNRRNKKDKLQRKESNSKNNNNDTKIKSNRRVSSNHSIRLQKLCGPPPVIIVTLAQSEDELTKDVDSESLNCDKTPNGTPIETTEVKIADSDEHLEEDINPSVVYSEVQQSQSQ